MIQPVKGVYAVQIQAGRAEDTEQDSPKQDYMDREQFEIDTVRKSCCNDNNY